MILTALSISNKNFIQYFILLIALMSGSALALNENQISILKQLTLQEYEEIDRELKTKHLYREAELYINRAMACINRRKRNHFFISENRKTAEKLSVKRSDNTTKLGIPYPLLRTFNLVQAMIHHGKEKAIIKITKDNRAAGVVTDYVDRLLSERAEQVPTEGIDWVNLSYEFRQYQSLGPCTIKAEKNKDFDYRLIHPHSTPYRKLHLLRNGELVLNNVNIIRQGNLEDGDQIIYPKNSPKNSHDNTSDYPKLSPIRNSASKAREIYMAVDRLQTFLDNRYPDKFRFSINDDNMFRVSLDFVVPYGWWQDAFFRVVFSFDNVGNEGPTVHVEYGPKMYHLFHSDLFLTNSYRNSKEYLGILYKNWSRSYSKCVHYGPEKFSIENQILNIINCVTTDFDIKTSGILAYNFHQKSPQSLITEEIILANTQAKKIDTPLYIETNHNKIANSVRERIKDDDDPVFDYLVMDDLDSEFDKSDDSESIKTDIFIPVKMYSEAEVLEFELTSIKNFHDLIYEARRKSAFKIPHNNEPVVYYKNKKLDEHNFKKVLYGIKKWSAIRKKKEAEKEGRKEKIKNKHKKKHDILPVIVKVPGYESRAFEIAKTYPLYYANYFIPENPRHLMHNDLAKKRAPRKLIKWEIHLVDNKKLAKSNNMLHQYKIFLPLETQKTTERYRGGTQYGSLPNIWIPKVRDDMSDVEKKFVLMSMYDLSRYKFKIPNNLKKASVSNLGNNIITKALLLSEDDKWMPTQAYLEFLLQRVQMSLLISDENYSIAKENNAFFESLINGNIDNNVIGDLAFFLGHLTPSLRYLSSMNVPDKVEITYRIVLNYLIETCVRALMHNELDASSEIVKQLIEKPEQFSLDAIYASNKKDIAVAFNVLQIVDFLFTKIVFNSFHKQAFDLTLYDHELEGLQLNIKNMRKIVDGEKNIMPLFLDHLFPTAKYYSGDLDFESEEFLNKFMLSVLKKYEDRTKIQDVKASLQALLKSKDQNSFFFSKDKTDELISLFRKKTPELLVNAPNGKGGFRQTCYHCRELYETENPIRGKGRTTNRTTGKPKETLVKPFHKACMKEDKRIRQQVGQLYKKMEKGYPKKQIFEPDYCHNPVPDGFELIRINGDGNCMFSSIAEIFNRNRRSGQAGVWDVWDQQAVRQIMDYNLRQIYSTIQDYPDKEKLMQELELLLGIDADVIPSVLNNNVITDSASLAQSELGRLQQFGDAQLIALLVPTQGVWFPVITQGDYGAHREIYDLKRWVNFAPNLLAILLENKNYPFPDLSESQRALLLQLLLSQNFDQARLFVAQILTNPHQSSAYLIHYPSSVALLEHFDAAVSIETPQNMEVNSPQTNQIDGAFEDSFKDEKNKRMKLDPASSVPNNKTGRETLQDTKPLLLRLQTKFPTLLTSPGISFNIM
ncbi:hypothetical protein [Endozoicomonas sp. ISHI1]|uniref:hypothetical protein n=1 Tax=Endozoicomonas sp. ISHI1 TaxID=2825882 RepID=UPI0021498DEC|nr:hypothetical protein [Endozoicomonas sp. ISHI1]